MLAFSTEETKQYACPGESPAMSVLAVVQAFAGHLDLVLQIVNDVGGAGGGETGPLCAAVSLSSGALPARRAAKTR